MHGLTGGSWKRSHDQAMAAEKNNPRETVWSQWLCDLPSITATAPVPDPPHASVWEVEEGAVLAAAYHHLEADAGEAG